MVVEILDAISLTRCRFIQSRVNGEKNARRRRQRKKDRVGQAKTSELVASCCIFAREVGLLADSNETAERFPYTGAGGSGDVVYQVRRLAQSVGSQQNPRRLSDEIPKKIEGFRGVCPKALVPRDIFAGCGAHDMEQEEVVSRIRGCRPVIR